MGIDICVSHHMVIQWYSISHDPKYSSPILPHNHPLPLSTLDPINEYDPTLEVIDLTNERLQDVGNISVCTKLQEIILRQNKLNNGIFTQLNQIPSLVSIDLYENRLTPIRKGEQPFSNLCNVEDLDLSFNELRFIRGFQGLTKLRHLYLIQNKITQIPQDVNVIGQHLEILELGSNRIRVIENLNNFPCLEQLFLGRNKVAAILPTSLANLPKLKLLSLQSNRITKLENLEPVKDTLEELYLSHNGISVVENVACCSHLRVLDLSNNRLTEVDGKELAQLTQLEELWLNGNQIESMDFLYDLKPLTNLRTIYLELNPCVGDISTFNPAGRQAYNKKIRSILPQLTQIDAEYFEEIDL